MAELRTRPPSRSALTAEQRRDLLRLVAAVPPDATSKHPAVIALLEYRRSLDTPWWAPGGTAYLRLPLDCYADGHTCLARGLDEMRRLAACEEWGDEAPRGSPAP